MKGGGSTKRPQEDAAVRQSIMFFSQYTCNDHHLAYACTFEYSSLFSIVLPPHVTKLMSYLSMIIALAEVRERF